MLNCPMSSFFFICFRQHSIREKVTEGTEATIASFLLRALPPDSTPAAERILAQQIFLFKEWKAAKKHPCL